MENANHKTSSCLFNNGLTDAEEIRRGELIASVLALKPVKQYGNTLPLYSTAWGSKTAIGLFRTIERIVRDGE